MRECGVYVIRWFGIIGNISIAFVELYNGHTHVINVLITQTCLYLSCENICLVEIIDYWEMKNFLKFHYNLLLLGKDYLWIMPMLIKFVTFNMKPVMAQSFNLLDNTRWHDIVFVIGGSTHCSMYVHLFRFSDIQCMCIHFRNIFKLLEYCLKIWKVV